MKKNQINILITGGAGYIGSVLAHDLSENGYNIFIIDNLERGHISLIPKRSKFFRGDFSNKKILKQVFRNKIDLIIHLAAYIEVEESTKFRKKYINNNFHKFKSFVKFSKKFCNNLIFASTASVYKSSNNKLTEESKLEPKNPYAQSKLLAENFLTRNKKKNKTNFIILRFFNVAGAHKKFKAGHITNKPTHLIKRLCVFALMKKKNFFIYGDKYETPDGTTVRDYIHIADLTKIISMLIPKILKYKVYKIFNCGYGKGYSVKEVFDEFNKLFKYKLTPKIQKERSGDLKILVADPKKIKKFLNWRPEFNKLSLILKSSMKWEKIINRKF